MNRSESEHVQTPPLSRDAQGLLFEDVIPELDVEAGRQRLHSPVGRIRRDVQIDGEVY